VGVLTISWFFRLLDFVFNRLIKPILVVPATIAFFSSFPQVEMHLILGEWFAIVEYVLNVFFEFIW
jgi:hypothetical protein